MAKTHRCSLSLTICNAAKWEFGPNFVDRPQVLVQELCILNDKMQESVMESEQ